MLKLVFADGHFGGLLNENVDGHECRVGKEAGVDATVCLYAANLFFDFVIVVRGGRESESLAGFVLERGRAHELADADVHVEQEIHFGDFGDVALDEYCSLLGVDACGEIFGENFLNIGVQLLRVRVCSERVEVGNEETTVEVVLNFDEFAQSAVLVAQMEVACRADATQDYFFAIRICVHM